MKKNLEKIFASASIVVAVILIMILLVTAFGGIDFDEFQSDLVRGLFITLAILYLVLSVIALILMFVKSDVVKDVVVKSEKGGAVRVSVKAIKRLVKQACAQLEDVKCKKVALVQDDYGVHLKVGIKVVGAPTQADENGVIEDKTSKVAEANLRALLEEMFMNEFNFKFVSTETKIMVITPKSKEVMEDLAAIAAEKAEENLAASEAENGEYDEEYEADGEEYESAEEEVEETEE